MTFVRKKTTAKMRKNTIVKRRRMRMQDRMMIWIAVLWVLFLLIMYSRQQVYTEQQWNYIRMKQNEATRKRYSR